jgi:hypothetical protein
MAEMMTARLGQQQQGQMVSGHYVAPNALQSILGPALSMFAAEKMGKGFDAEQAGIAGQRNEQLSSGLKNYFDTRQGKPGEVLGDVQAQNLMTNDQAPALAEPTAADPRRAAIEALTSQLPELQALGKSDMAGMGKESLSQKDILSLSGFDPKSRLAAALSGGDLTQLAPQREFMNIDGRVVDKNDPTKVGADYREQFSSPYYVGADRIQKDSRGKEFMVDNVPKVNVNTSIDNVGNKVSLEQAGKVLGGARQDMIDSMAARKSAETVMQLSKDPATIQGFAAGPSAGLAAIGAKLGLTGPEAAAKTQALVAELARKTLEAGQDMKGSFTDKDIVFLRDVSTGSIALTPEVLQHAAGMSMAAAHNKTMNALKQYQGASEVTGVGEILKLYPRPNINYQLDDKTFSPLDDGQTKFNSPLLQPSGNPGGAKPTVSNW